MSENTTNSSSVRNTAQYLLDIDKAGAKAFDAGALKPEYSRMVVDAASLAKKEDDDELRILDFMGRHHGIGILRASDVVEFITHMNRVFDLSSTAVREAIKKAVIRKHGKKATGKLPLNEMVEQMNDDPESRVSHALTMLGGKAVIMRKSPNPNDTNHLQTEFLRPVELSVLYQHDTYECGTNSAGAPAFKDKITAWASSPKCRRYPNGVYFYPVREGEEIDRVDGALNLWGGMETKPLQGDWQLIDDHVFNVLAGGNKEVYTYILDWCAHTLQYPEKQAGAVLVFRGKKRIGKGLFGHFLRKLWGQHGLHISNGNHLTGKFNQHLANTCLLFADEAFFAGDKQHEGVLKAMISDDVLTIEGKGLGIVQLANRLKIIMATNEKWVVPTSADDARYLVADVSDCRKGDTAYFKALAAQIDSEAARSAFLHDMLNRDISTFHPGTIPDTAGAREQRLYSLDATSQWFLDCLERGHIAHTGALMWEPWLPSSIIFDSYLDFCDRQKISNRLSANKLGRWLGNEAGLHNKAANNSRGWVFPFTAEECLKSFCDKNKI